MCFVYKKIFIVKLFFNVIDIVEMVWVVEVNGVDSVLLINILLGMVIDVECKCFIFLIVIGGMFGVVVKFIVLRMVW